eukprot:gene1514-8064_t
MPGAPPLFARLLSVAAAASAAAAPPARWDACAFLEREMAGRMTPFLAGRRGAMYFAGQSLAGGDVSPVWPVRENETRGPSEPAALEEGRWGTRKGPLGITHAFFRDGRARGEAIVCDEVTGAEVRLGCVVFE